LNECTPFYSIASRNENVLPAGPVSRLTVTLANNAPMSAAEAGLSADPVKRPAEFGLERLGVSVETF
jgi:hypothetical protein